MGSQTSSWHSLRFHEEADSPYLYNSIEYNQWLWFRNEKNLYMELGKQTDTINIKKSNYTCDEYNSNSFMHCMENYYSKKMGCILPWTLNNNLEYDNMKICKGKEKFKLFRNIAMNILKPEESNELINEGCFIPNCVQRLWKIKKENYDDNEKNGKLTTGFQYEWFQHTPILLREEVELYTLVNFFAEVGGYLGLLLGESLLSYVITTSRWVQVLWVKFKANCWKKGGEESLSSS